MTCAEVIELAAAYALGALEPGERAEVEAHLASAGPHQGCREAVDRARNTTAELARALHEVRPSPGVWSAIEARVRDAPAARPRRWVAPLGFGAAAAAAILAVLLVREVLDSGRFREEAERAHIEAVSAAADRERLRGELRALESASALEREVLDLLDAPGARLVALAPQPGQAGRATAILDVTGHRAVIASTSLPPQAGLVYQLWVIRGSAAPSPAGFLATTSGGASVGEIDRSLLQGPLPDALAVSLEPAGGSPSPTRVVLVGRVAG